ncbi:hypothetical protein [Parashewanella tropica]|uniref:hypothetical protein n=1 Tax=Parashewanella tropica TaxID=2547970 RepID=UPI00105932A4|nr:hypothetical protein [Parashewanella tropica]
MFLSAEYLFTVKEQDYQNIEFTPARFETSGLLGHRNAYQVAVNIDTQELQAFYVHWFKGLVQVNTEFPRSESERYALQYRNTVLTADSTPENVTAKTICCCNRQSLLTFFLQCSTAKREALIIYLLQQIASDNEVIPNKKIIQLLNDLSSRDPYITQDLFSAILAKEGCFKTLLQGCASGVSDLRFVSSIRQSDLIRHLEKIGEEEQQLVLQAKIATSVTDTPVDGQVNPYFDVSFFEQLSPKCLAAVKHWPTMLIAHLLSDLPLDKAQVILALLPVEQAADALYELQSEEDDKGVLKADDTEESVDEVTPYVLLYSTLKLQEINPRKQTHAKQRFMALVLVVKPEVHTMCFAYMNEVKRGEWFKEIERQHPEQLAQKINEFAVTYPDRFISMMSAVGRDKQKKWGSLLTPDSVAYMSMFQSFSQIMASVFVNFDKKSCNAWCQVLKDKRCEVELLYKQDAIPFEKKMALLDNIDYVLRYLTADILGPLLKKQTPVNVTCDAQVRTGLEAEPKDDIEQRDVSAAVVAFNRSSSESIADYADSPTTIAVMLNSLSISEGSHKTFISMCQRLLTQPLTLFLQVVLCLDDRHYQFLAEEIHLKLRYQAWLSALTLQDFQNLPEEISYTRASQFALKVWRKDEDTTELQRFFSVPQNQHLTYLLAEFEPAQVHELLSSLDDTQNFLQGFMPVMREIVLKSMQDQNQPTPLTLFSILSALPEDKVTNDQFTQFVVQLKGCRIELIRRLGGERAKELVQRLQQKYPDLVDELVPEIVGLYPRPLLELFTLFSGDWVMRVVHELNKETIADLFVNSQFDKVLMERLAKLTLRISSMHFVAGLTKFCSSENKADNLKVFFEFIEIETLRISCLEQLPPLVIAEVVIQDRAYFGRMAEFLPETRIREVNDEMTKLGVEPEDLIQKR